MNFLLSENELLQIWEIGFNQAPHHFALFLISCAYSVQEKKDVQLWSIGQRDAHLFRFREHYFGSRFLNVSRCTSCSEDLEWEIQISDFPIPDLAPSSSTKAHLLEAEDWSIQFRLPNSRDVLEKEPEKLLDNCILTIEKDKKQLASKDLPDTVRQLLLDKMEELDPLSNFEIILNCPSCNHQWRVLFDIAGYLWKELDSWSKHLLQEVFLLARGYGWSEKDILNMNPQRRRIYIEYLQS